MGRIIILTLSFTIVYFALKGLLWQIKGVRNISIGDGELKLNKLSPLWSNTKTYRLSDIKSIDVKDESVAEGPFALLHLLNITDKIKINMTYGYQTITTISGVDIFEANEIKNRIENLLTKQNHKDLL